jgi:hypothetical protein
MTMFQNGDQVTWGSHDILRPEPSVQDLEELGSIAAAAALEQVEDDLRQVHRAAVRFKDAYDRKEEDQANLYWELCRLLDTLPDAPPDPRQDTCLSFAWLITLLAKHHSVPLEDLSCRMGFKGNTRPVGDIVQAAMQQWKLHELGHPGPDGIMDAFIDWPNPNAITDEQNEVWLRLNKLATDAISQRNPKALETAKHYLEVLDNAPSP